MNTPTPWLYGLAAVVVLYIVQALSNRPATERFRGPLALAAYFIGIVLIFTLGGWPALALWWGIGVVFGLSACIHDYRRARHSKGSEVKPPSLAAVLRGLFTWPIMIPFAVVVGVLVIDLGDLFYSLYKTLLPNRVPHYRRIEECKKSAISGDPRAQLTLGDAYEQGQYGLVRDYAESAKWYRKAAEQNHGAAQLRLGRCLAEGKGAERDVVEGLMWVLLARHVIALHSEGWFLRDAAIQAIARVKAQMTEQQIAEAGDMLDASPLYKEVSSRYDRA